MTESLQQSASQLDCSEYEREAASPERFDKRAQRSEVELHFLGEGNRQELYIHTCFLHPQLLKLVALRCRALSLAAVNVCV